MFKKIVCVVLLGVVLSAASMDEFEKFKDNDFDTYKKSQEDYFKDYQQSQMKVFEKYKKELGAYWEEPKVSTKKAWVSYAEDKKTRTDVDFSKNISSSLNIIS